MVVHRRFLVLLQLVVCIFGCLEPGDVVDTRTSTVPRELYVSWPTLLQNEYLSSPCRFRQHTTHNERTSITQVGLSTTSHYLTYVGRVRRRLPETKEGYPRLYDHRDRSMVCYVYGFVMFLQVTRESYSFSKEDYSFFLYHGSTVNRGSKVIFPYRYKSRD